MANVLFRSENAYLSESINNYRLTYFSKSTIVIEGYNEFGEIYKQIFNGKFSGYPEYFLDGVNGRITSAYFYVNNVTILEVTKISLPVAAISNGWNMPRSFLTDSDMIKGSGGDDVIISEQGSDKVSAGQGSDLIAGGQGRDLIRGEADADTIYGEEGNDKIFGGSGSDGLSGGKGQDKVYGGGGNDLIHGNQENDRLFGGAGRDTLNGGDNDDVLTGSSGKDVFMFERRDGHDIVTDFRNGIDKLHFDKLKTFADLVISQDGDDLVVSFKAVSVTLLSFDEDQFDKGDLLFL